MIDPIRLARLKQHAATWWSELKSIALFVVLMVVFRSAVADWSDVPTGSMKPTIIEGDRIFINKMAYNLRVPLTHFSLLHLADPQRGDIIIFDSAVSRLRLVKRVIGVPGDVVEVRGDVVSVNGVPLQYRLPEAGEVSDAGQSDLAVSATDMIERIPTTASDGSSAVREYTVRMSNGGRLSNHGPVEVPDGFYFALGDNRDNSADSRVIGMVPRSEIIGRSGSVAFSLDYENSYLPRTDRFLRPL